MNEDEVFLDEVASQPGPQLDAPVAVVTGAASGIGRATAEHLLDAWWAVGALDRDQGGLDFLLTRYPRRLFSRRVNVVDSVDVVAAFEAVRNALGPFRAVVSAAGVWTPRPARAITDDRWNQAITVNLTGSFNTARALDHFLDDRGGAPSSPSRPTVVGAVVSRCFSFMNGAAVAVDEGSTVGYYTPREM